MTLDYYKLKNNNIWFSTSVKNMGCEKLNLIGSNNTNSAAGSATARKTTLYIYCFVIALY